MSAFSPYFAIASLAIAVSFCCSAASTDGSALGDLAPADVRGDLVAVPEPPVVEPPQATSTNRHTTEMTTRPSRTYARHALRRGRTRRTLDPSPATTAPTLNARATFKHLLVGEFASAAWSVTLLPGSVAPAASSGVVRRSLIPSRNRIHVTPASDGLEPAVLPATAMEASAAVWVAGASRRRRFIRLRGDGGLGAVRA